MSEPIIINGSPVDGYIYSTSPDFVKICTAECIPKLGGVGEDKLLSLNDKRVVLQSVSFEYKVVYDDYDCVNKLELVECNYLFKFVK